jgi:nucleoside-diphosphate-sugar epimerase
MRVMVAGGAGFIGSHVSEELLRRGHEVVCVDNLSTGRGPNIAQLYGQPRFEFLKVDIAAVPTVEVDVVLHLASPASPVDYQLMPLETLAANSIGTWRLLDVARDTGARFVYASTSEVYGDPLVHPQPESYWGNVDPVGPRSCYDEGKRFGEALVTSYRAKHGVRASILRFFNTYGPRMRRDDGRVMPELISAALDGRPLTVHGDGSQTRSFCYVDDLVEAVLAVILDPLADGLVLNVGNPEEVTIRELAKTILRYVRPDGMLDFVKKRPGDPERRRPVIKQIQDRYGWSPSTRLNDGLARTINWFVTESASVIPAPDRSFQPVELTS